MRDTINGYPILGLVKTPKQRATRPGAFVLVDTQRKNDRYVTGWSGDGDNGWLSGHYFDDLPEALEDFCARARAFSWMAR